MSLPDGLEHVRTTDVFDAETVPTGLLRAHRLAADTWGLLVVQDGQVRLVFEDGSGESSIVESGGSAVIQPQRPHHVELDDGARFSVAFHRPAR